MKKTAFVGFCGGGLADIGLKNAGYEICGAVEIEPTIADVYRLNHGDNITVADICTVDWRRLEKPNLFWVSPSCKNASVANAKGGETALDFAVAEAICRALREWQPEQFFLENVPAYRHFRASGLIAATLEELGYWQRSQVFNMADWGVPQTRVRLILRATRGDLAGQGQSALFGGGKLPEIAHQEPWNGWFDAIGDLVPDLPDSQFAEWQLARMGEGRETAIFDAQNCQKSRLDRARNQPAFTVTCIQRPSHFPNAFITDSRSTSLEFGITTRGNCEPMFTILASAAKGCPRAFIVEGSAAGATNLFTMPIRDAQEPVFTMRATQNNPRAWLETGRVVRMTPRALARFQSVPDSYLLPEGNATFLDGKHHHLAATIIGNGVPPLFTEKLATLHCGGVQ